MLYVKLYFIALSIFVSLDALWLGWLAKNFYFSQLGFLMRSPPLWGVAFLFYLLNLVGLIIFCLQPALKEGSLAQAFFLGALYGFFTYSTYDLTNLATLNNWPPLVTLVDMLWGTLLSSLVSGGTFYCSRLLKII